MVKVIKPRTLGILTRTQQWGTETLFIVSAFGLFDVAQPGVFLADQALWPAVVKEMPEGAVFDPGMIKPQGEMLVAGRAIAPGGEPVPSMLMECGVGSLVKRAAVFGDRYWEATHVGYAASAPRPFTDMPIDMKRMFGGAHYDLNQSGTGFNAARSARAGQICFLPNFEDPRRLIRSIDDTPPPAGLVPIDPMSKERQKYAGTYDRHWRENLAPGLPADADLRVFCHAPEDQRITGFFAGDEPVRVKGMTPDPEGYEGSLPRLRARAFVMRTSEPAGLVELTMNLDTVLLLGSLGKGVVIFRGAIAVADADAKDAASVMIAYEHLGAEPRPFNHYAEVYRLRTDKIEAPKYAFAESQLSPPRSEAQVLKRRKSREDYNRERAEIFADGAHLMMRKQFAEAGLPASLLPARPEPVLSPVLVPSPEELESGDIDLADLLDQMDAHFVKEQQKLIGLKAAIGPGGAVDFSKLAVAIEALGGQSSGGTGIAESMSAAQKALPSLDGLLADLEEKPEVSKDRLAGALEAATAAFSGAALSPPAAPPDDEAFATARGRFLGDPEVGILAPARRAVADVLRADAERAAQPAPEKKAGAAPAGKILAGLDQVPPGPGEAAVKAKMAGLEDQLAANFPGLRDKPGGMLENLLADIAGAAPAEPRDVPSVLGDTQARISDAEVTMQEGMGTLRRLAPAATFPLIPLDPAIAAELGAFVFEQWRDGLDLRGRDLAGADLSGRDLSGADLTGAFLENTNLSRTILRNAICRDAVFTGALLEGACFDGADLHGANLSSVKGAKASFKQAGLENVTCLESVFPGAGFEGARFANTALIKIDFTAARFTGARFNKMSFIQCPFDDAVADGAVFERCQLIDFSARNFSFREGGMIRSQCVKMIAPNADFSGANLDRSGFASGAELQESRFIGASLVGTTLQEANLTGADFTRARLDTAVFGGAHASGARFICASMKRAQMGGADLTRADFFAANLFQAQLRRANFRGAYLRAANLYSADLSGADMTGADLTFTNCAKTRLALETSHAS